MQNTVVEIQPPAIQLASPSLLKETQPLSQQKEKLLITGDDVLIEYVARLMIAVKSIKEHMLRPVWKH